MLTEVFEHSVGLISISWITKTKKKIEKSAELKKKQVIVKIKYIYKQVNFTFSGKTY